MSVVLATAGGAAIASIAPDIFGSRELAAGIYVPEPPTLLLAASGLAGIAAIRRRKIHGLPSEPTMKKLIVTDMAGSLQIKQ